MTNINCSLNCIYQKDGKCSYTSVSPSSISFSECAYFIRKENENSK
ncbi:MAG: hydroxymyristoyl-ACP dehydratase [Clostridia bacterium]|nr:hydroxymyristoyl-ACP dehydratase [Clostridia bacterium]